jgi:hypothetical protein
MTSKILVSFRLDRSIQSKLISFAEEKELNPSEAFRLILKDKLTKLEYWEIENGNLQT